MSLLPIMKALFDPRGRCNRRGFVVAAIVLLGLEVVGSLALWAAGLPLDHPLVIAFKATLVYQAFVAASLRLHDVGHSSWRMLWAAFGMLLWAVVVAVVAAHKFTDVELQIGGPGFAMIFAAVSIPMLGMLLWLHFAPGQAATNRHGPVPSGLGFAAHESRHRATEGVSAAV